MKKNIVIKDIIAIVIATVIILSISGCKKNENEDPLMSESKESLVSIIRALQSDNESAGKRISELETMLRGIQGSEIEKAAITEFSDGTGRLTLNSSNGMVKLPEPFEYPNSIQTYNVSSLKLYDNIYVKPSSNWIVTLSGTQIILEYPESGVSGIIKVGKIDGTQENVKVAELSSYIDKFFESMPPETITYNRIYVAETWRGMDARAHTFIDEEDAQLRCGMIGIGENCVTYFFAYKGDQSSINDELIQNLLQTLTINSNALRIE